MLFLLDFEERGEVPIMSEDNYRMAYTMISVTIVPAASISTFLFQKVSINITVSITSLILPLRAYLS